MNRTQKIVLGIAAFVIVISAFMAVANKTLAPEAPIPDAGGEISGSATGKAAPATLVDGEYFVRITQILRSPEDTVVSISHVTYFEGAEARLSAERDVKCAGAIETCVPTLANGYYVRESGAPGFEAPVVFGAKIVLANNASATVDDLADAMKTVSYVPVYRISMLGGQIVEIIEITK